MGIGVDILSSLYFYGLGLMKRENNLYCFVDLETGEWYEKMTIYYIRKLLKQWNHERDMMTYKYQEIPIENRN